MAVKQVLGARFELARDLIPRDFKPDQNIKPGNDLATAHSDDPSKSDQKASGATSVSASYLATCERRCPRCDTVKPLSEFGTRLRRGKRCALPYCRACHVAYHREWRETPVGKEKYARAEAASKARYPERDRAREALRRAVARGSIIKGGCVVGGDCAGKIEAHHDDYAKPLDVQWVCRGHHRQLDRQRRAS